MRLVGLLAVVAFASGTRAANADRYEATAGVDVRGGVARLPEDGAATAMVPAVGATLRLSHAWRDTLAWEVQLGGTLAQPATYVDVMRTIDGRPQVGDITRRTITGTASIGAELRLGFRWVPIVRLGLGPQLRHRGGSDLGVFPDAVPPSTSLDAVASIALGLDLRIGAHRLIGVALQVDHGQPIGDAPGFDVLCVSVRVSHAWYPRWWAPDW